MARTTSGGMIEPPSTVTVPTPLIKGLTPRRVYTLASANEFTLAPRGAAKAPAAGRAAVAFKNPLRVARFDIFSSLTAFYGFSGSSPNNGRRTRLNVYRAGFTAVKPGVSTGIILAAMGS